MRVMCIFVLLLAGLGAARASQGLTGWIDVHMAGWFVLPGVMGIAGALCSALWVRRVLLGLAVVMLGAGWWVLRSTPSPGTLFDVLSVQAGDAPIVVTVQGRLRTRPESGPEGQAALSPYMAYTPAARFELAVERIRSERGWVRAEGTLLVRVLGVDGVERLTITSDVDSPGAGDRVVLTGRAQGIAGSLNPGSTDAQAWAVQAGVAGTLMLDDPRLIEKLPAYDDSWRGRALGRVLSTRARLMMMAEDALRPPEAWRRRGLPNSPERVHMQEAAALVDSLVLGVDEPRQEEVQRRFTRLGVVHVLAISGYHVAVLAGILALTLRVTGDRGRLEGLLIAAGVVLYLAIVPASSPVIRAGLCISAVLVSRMIGRRYDPLCTLLWAGIGLMLWRPGEVFTLGYILSVGLCILLVAVGRRVHTRLAGPTLRGLIRPRRTWLGEARTAIGTFLTATVLCWLISMPIIAWWTGWCSPVTILASVVIVPLVSALLVMGLVQVVLVLGLVCTVGWVAPGVVEGVREMGAYVLHGAGAGVLWLVDVVDAMPMGSLRMPPFSLGLAITITAILLGWLLRGRWNHRVLWAATVCTLGWAGFEIVWRTELHGDEILRCDVLAVGDGLCTSVRSKDAAGVHRVLVGAGAARANLGVRMAPAAFRSLGAWRVETVIVPGAEPRHFSFVPELVEHMGVKRVYLHQGVEEMAQLDPGSPQAGLLRILRERRVPIEWISASTRIELGEESVIRLEAGGSAWNVIVERRAGRDDAQAMVAVVQDASGRVPSARVQIVASSAAGEGGVERVRRVSESRMVIVSSGDLARGYHAQDPRVMWTARDGAIDVRLARGGEVVVRGFVDVQR